DLVETAVEHRHHGDVWLDRRKRVVGGLGPGFGECVEERGLAGVGQPDDADASAHTSASAVPVAQVASASAPSMLPASLVIDLTVAAMAVPRTAPARTSDG